MTENFTITTQIVQPGNWKIRSHNTLNTRLLQIVYLWWHVSCFLSVETTQINNMKLSKRILALLATGVFSCGLFSQQAQATAINGDIQFAGTAQFNTNSLLTATRVVTWINTHVEAGNTGDFSGIAMNTPATFGAPWVLSTPTPGLWSVGGFTFDLLSSNIVTQNAGELTITGTGMVSANGFDPTAMDWSFTTQSSSGRTRSVFSFSANGMAVPDGGSAVSLLGCALLGLAALRRKLSC